MEDRMITAVGGTKGGTGKSTVATNVAVMHALRRRDVLLVDADEQGTSAAFTNMRNQTRPDGAGYTCVALTGRAVLTEVRQLAPKYDEVVIDLAGANGTSQRSALAVCDVYLVPFAPRSFDVWALDKVVELVEEARGSNPDLHVYAFLNRADARGSDNAAAGAIIAEHKELEFIPLVLGNRKAYARAATTGLSVVELSPPDPIASSEMQNLFRYLNTRRVRTSMRRPAERASVGN